MAVDIVLDHKVIQITISRDCSLSLLVVNSSYELC